MKMFIVLAAIFQLLVAHTAAENFYIWNVSLASSPHSDASHEGDTGPETT